MFYSYSQSFDIGKLIGESSRNGDEFRKDIKPIGEVRATAIRLWDHEAGRLVYDTQGLMDGYVVGYFLKDDFQI